MKKNTVIKWEEQLFIFNSQKLPFNSLIFFLLKAIAFFWSI